MESESTGTSIFGAIEEMFKVFFDFLGEILTAFLEVLPTALSFCLWAITALFILPCVWIAAQIYPMWVKWGEGF